MVNRLRFSNSIHEIGSEIWQKLLNTDNPFLRFEFLAALEDTLCIDTPKKKIALNSGWIPHYAILEDEENTAIAIAPVFKKLHSYGEYVFDWAWADAYQRHGLNYYPKLIWAIPFTPSSGPRIISQGSPSQRELFHQQIANGLSQYCQQNNLSSWHCLFPDDSANNALCHNNDSSYLNSHLTKQTSTTKTRLYRKSCQFHWFNNDFTDFSNYLEKFTSRKRKNIKKERARLLDAGFVFHQKVASQITEADIENFYHCYQLTYAKRNRRGYLTLAFFKQLLTTMPDQLLLVQAQLPANQGSHIVANALYFKDADNLYGRYWGCLEEYDSLHFECCYYQGIEFCIKNHLTHFDPGTQGEHKISRGFEPTICHSQHWIAHPQFREAIDGFIQEEQTNVDAYSSLVAQHLPFKRC